MRAREGGAGDRGPIRLTPREREVLARVAAGQTSKQIAAALAIGVRTVETHRENLKRKLGASSVATLIRYALTHGLVDD
jgi:two-component system, NarL family, nitrate/nitrite response regulator NarL